MLRRSLAVLSIIAAPALAQDTGATSPQRSATAYARGLWKEVSDYLIKAAADAPDSVFRYKPTPDVRSFGETLDHVAASQNGYCHLALGEKPVGGGAGTGAKTRAEIVAALRASNELCAHAYAQTDADAA